MDTRFFTSKLWVGLLVLRATVLNNLQPCSAQIQIIRPVFDPKTVNQKYLYLHNETRIAMAMAEAELALAPDGGHGTFPSFDPPLQDGCKWNTVAPRLSFHGMRLWDHGSTLRGVDEVEVLAVDSCTEGCIVELGHQLFNFCSQEWVNRVSGIIDEQRRFFEVFVKIRTQEREILADGVYFPATGRMHLAGCTGWRNVFNGTRQEEITFPVPVIRGRRRHFRFVHGRGLNPHFHTVRGKRGLDPHFHIVRGRRGLDPPLNVSASSQDCAVSATLQYPRLSVRWNSERFVKYSIRSTRAKDDPLYFPPKERSMFLPYERRHLEAAGDAVHSQRRLEIWGRSLILVLGLVCIALQIEHGRNNEEALPFVSLVMLGIQLAHHLSQTSMFKDLQISTSHVIRLQNGDLTKFVEIYGIMAWSAHVPYQAMAMTALFMYVWIFHKVGDRRRIMELRVRRGKPGARDPPSDWGVMYATVALFGLVGLPLLYEIGADRYSSPSNHDSPPFVSSQLYEALQAQWGFVNKFTGLVVSLYLVPQLLGNMQWELQGRPLSVWFYAGIPLLQSLPHIVRIAKHFQLLPIFPFYDPYLNSIFGVFEDPDPWWQIGVLSSSALQVLAVHCQFAKAELRASTSPNV